MPSSIGHWQVSHLPVSSSLLGALERLGIHYLKDVNVISIKDLSRVSFRSADLAVELGNLIDLVRKGKIQIWPPNHSPLHQPAVKKPNAGETDHQVLPEPQPTTVSPPEQQKSELIFIPQAARSQPIEDLSISVRLANILAASGFRFLGDIHGLPFTDFLKFRNCGRKTVAELRKVVRLAPHTAPSVKAPSIKITPPKPVQDKRFFVPSGAQDLNPFELPLSVRLEKTLRIKGITHVGDLHRIPIVEFLRLRNCGQKTVKELIHLLERIITGEFQPITEGFSINQVAEKLQLLEQILDKLSSRNREILLLRFGAQDGRVWTLGEVGAKFGITLQCVRQVVQKTIPWFRKEGGPKLAHLLHGIESTCAELACSLGPPLLAQWLGTGAVALRYPLHFWVRFLAALNPAIPCSPHGQEPAVLLLRLEK